MTRSPAASVSRGPVLSILVRVTGYQHGHLRTRPFFDFPHSQLHGNAKWTEYEPDPGKAPACPFDDVPFDANRVVGQGPPALPACRASTASTVSTASRNRATPEPPGQFGDASCKMSVALASLFWFPKTVQTELEPHEIRVTGT